MTGEIQHDYELVYVLQPNLDEQGIVAINERVEQIVTGANGTMTTTELWGRRTLAYPIKKNFEGHYVMQRFAMDPEKVGDIDRVLRFNENVMRYLVLRNDEE
ncbi:MAG: 30S ribosomal protein S6 [Litorilinea sp.]